MENEFIYIIAKAEEYRKMGNTAKELTLLSEAAEREDAPPLINVMLGRCYREQSKFEKAVEQFQKAQKKDPNYTTAFLSEGEVYLAAGRFNRRTVELFETALALTGENEPTYPAILANYALSLGMTGERYKAIDFLKRARNFGFPEKNTKKYKKMLAIKRFEWLSR